MKYTPEERLDIGRKIYHNELTRYEAASIYGISAETARSYMREYRDTSHLPPKKAHEHPCHIHTETVLPESWESYQNMSKDELLDELIKSKVNEARLKKGYTVKGSGAHKEYFRLVKKNTK